MEPNLKNIEDYNTLKGSKKRIVWIVISSGLLLGAVYSYYVTTSQVSDNLKQDSQYSKLPPQE